MIGLTAGSGLSCEFRAGFSNYSIEDPSDFFPFILIGVAISLAFLVGQNFVYEGVLRMLNRCKGNDQYLLEKPGTVLDSWAGCSLHKGDNAAPNPSLCPASGPSVGHTHDRRGCFVLIPTKLLFICPQGVEHLLGTRCDFLMCSGGAP